jgi:peptidyl-Asp metalloendopeptidase
MISKTNRQTRRAVAAAIWITGLAGVTNIGFAAPPMAEPALKALQRVSDAALPAIAKRGTGAAGAFNLSAMDQADVSVTLSDGRVIKAQRQRLAEDKGRGRKSWVGTFVEEPGSIAAFSTVKGVTTGFITYGAETWEVMPGHAGKHLLYRVDGSKLPTDEKIIFAEPTERDLLAVDDYGTGGVAATDASAGYVHDLLVVYTPAARAAYGQATLESMIQNAVQVANQAYQNSNVGITLNLVGLEEIAYNETGDMQASLYDLRGTTDGKMDSVHKLRDTLGADVVSLISQDTSSCGIAFSMRSESTSFAASAFNVVKPSCLSQHSLAHEVGHNQGNMHDRESTTNTGAFPYSYGLRRCASDGTGFRTVMAYSCTGAKRVAWFSNPSVYYNGYSTGISYESNSANSADNARSMNNTADTFAAFRAGGGGSSAATVTAPTAPSSLSATATSASAVTARWTDNSNDETGFKIERSSNGVEFVEIATLGAGATSYFSNGLTALTTYYYRVRAYNSAGNSSYSSIVSVKTLEAAPAAPAAPSSVSAYDGGDGSATVAWADASSNETGFEVRRETWDAKRSVWKGLTTVGSVPSGITSLVDLAGKGTYRYTVRAVNAGGGSGYAGPARVDVTGGTRGKNNRK